MPYFILSKNGKRLILFGDSQIIFNKKQVTASIKRGK